MRNTDSCNLLDSLKTFMMRRARGRSGVTTVQIFKLWPNDGAFLARRLH